VPVLDVFVTVIALVGPFVAGAMVGYWLRGGRVQVMLALTIGVLLTLAGLGIWYMDAPTSAARCYECSEYWGRWMDETMVTVWLPLTLILWSTGVAAGSSKQQRPRPHSRATA
jgi:hypothetical protein